MLFDNDFMFYDFMFCDCLDDDFLLFNRFFSDDNNRNDVDVVDDNSERFSNSFRESLDDSFDYWF